MTDKRKEKNFAHLAKLVARAGIDGERGQIELFITPGHNFPPSYRWDFNLKMWVDDKHRRHSRTEILTLFGVDAWVLDQSARDAHFLKGETIRAPGYECDCKRTHLITQDVDGIPTKILFCSDCGAVYGAIEVSNMVGLMPAGGTINADGSVTILSTESDAWLDTVADAKRENYFGGSL